MEEEAEREKEMREKGGNMNFVIYYIPLIIIKDSIISVLPGALGVVEEEAGYTHHSAPQTICRSLVQIRT